MRKSAQVRLWAVYQMTVQGQPGPNVVCYQHEWEAVEKATPGLHRLIQGGILNEGEAERLARGTSGAAKARMRKKLIAELLDVEPDLLAEAGEEEEIGEDQGDVEPAASHFPTLAQDTGESDTGAISSAQVSRAGS